MAYGLDRNEGKYWQTLVKIYTNLDHFGLKPTHLRKPTELLLNTNEHSQVGLWLWLATVPVGDSPEEHISSKQKAVCAICKGSFQVLGTDNAECPRIDETWGISQSTREGAVRCLGEPFPVLSSPNHRLHGLDCTCAESRPC